MTLNPIAAQTLAYHLPAQPSPVARLIAALNAGHTPSDAELADLMTALHAAVLEKPLMNWLTHSFEDMADTVLQAIGCAALEELQMEVA